MNAQKNKDDRRSFLAALHAVPVCQQRVADTDWFPAVDVTETSQGYGFEFDLPGLTRREIQISVPGNTLCLAGVRTTLRQGGKALRVERPAGEFVRRLLLPPDACGDEIRVTLQDGVLHLHVPKQPYPDETNGSRPAPVGNQFYEHIPN
jgi:HSP20 family molecular chaperone IbpA